MEMGKNLRYGISALVMGAALAVATPSFAHHTGWTPGGGGSAPSGAGAHAAPSGTPHGFGPAFHGPFGAAHAHVFGSGQSFAHFNPAQRTAWSHGRWWHGHRGGRDGWWWFAGGGWFFYPFAVYPYPDYVSSYSYYDDDYYGPPGGGQQWYYCYNPAGYYPYVQNCNGPWRPVPMTPPPPGAQQGMNQGPDAGPPPDGGPDDSQDQGPPQNGPNNGPNGGPANGPPANMNGPPPGNPPPGY
jgi:hypothetical protein